MNNIEKISNEPSPVPRMTPSQEGSADVLMEPPYGDIDSSSMDEDETTTRCCPCSCTDASCDGFGGIQTILACCVAIPVGIMACFSCCF
ncbi:hypothetical protein B0J17DRAFT_717860 [Rhizoctonia solani]|nr:hypothetical protein B0J17DRAFT_717860 [Rhizoctonia solani]